MPEPTPYPFECSSRDCDAAAEGRFWAFLDLDGDALNPQFSGYDVPDGWLVLELGDGSTTRVLVLCPEHAERARHFIDSFLDDYQG
jgi:hypothetical protein